MSLPLHPEPLPPATARRVAEIVDYAPGAIVSSVLGKSANATITLFAFDRGQDLSEHTAPFDAFVHVLDGAAELVIGGRTVRAEAGEIVLMPKGVPHAVQARERFKMLLTLLRG